MVFTFKPLPPKEALAFFRKKTVGTRFSYGWQDVWQEEHAAAFVVAKAMRADILKHIYAGLEEALSEGLTAREFAKRVRPLLEKKGWWGFKRAYDPVTGLRRVAELGTPRRLRTIYDVNLRTARAAGRWERIERQVGLRPYLLYQDAGDGRVRQAHRRMHNILLPVEHPFWNTYYPPNGWRCRCIVRQVTKRWMQANGVSVTGEMELRQAGHGRTMPWKNTRTGKTQLVPLGVDPGFAHNVGHSRLGELSPRPDGGTLGERAITRRAFAPGGDPLPLLAPRLAAASRLLPDDISARAAVRAFIDEFDGPLFFDAAQVPHLINEEMFTTATGRLKTDKRARTKYMLLMADALKSPDEIWAGVEIKNNGEVILRRRALARFRLPGETVSGVVVFEEEGHSVWRAITVFPAANGKPDEKQIKYLLANVRVGNLIYRREEDK